MRIVSSNLANYHATVQKLLIRQVLTQCSRIRIFRFFQISKNMTFYVCFEMTYQKVVKSHQKELSSIRHQAVITSLNDHCNSIPSSQEPLLNILADRINRSEQNYKRDQIGRRMTSSSTEM